MTSRHFTTQEKRGNKEDPKRDIHENPPPNEDKRDKIYSVNSECGGKKEAGGTREMSEGWIWRAIDQEAMDQEDQVGGITENKSKERDNVIQEVIIVLSNWHLENLQEST